MELFKITQEVHSKFLYLMESLASGGHTVYTKDEVVIIEQGL